MLDSLELQIARVLWLKNSRVFIEDDFVDWADESYSEDTCESEPLPDGEQTCPIGIVYRQ